jgi:colanic acid biosynthesis glycosyl transferase WcaI
MSEARGRIWVVSELYYPELTSTGYYLTRIAEGLAATFTTHALCSQPTYSARGFRAPAREIRNGVHIHRVPSTTFDKNVLPLRMLNALTITASMFAVAIASFRRGDAILVVTNPPFLPFAMRLACGLRGAACVLLVHDVYPDVLVITGHLRESGLRLRTVAWLTKRLYRSMSRVVVIGRDMQRRIGARVGRTPMELIPNWADLDAITPMDRQTSPILGDLGLQQNFVVQYSGNMGRSHALGVIVDAAAALAGDPAVHFLLAGSGAQRAWLEDQVVRRGLTNVTIRDPFPREQLNQVLAACDVAIVTLEAGMAGVSVPSRMYNILAAARPLIAVADRESDLAGAVEREQIGWVVAPGDAAGLVQAIASARRDPAALATKGARARQVAERDHQYGSVIRAFVRLFESLNIKPMVDHRA